MTRTVSYIALVFTFFVIFAGIFLLTTSSASAAAIISGSPVTCSSTVGNVVRMGTVSTKTSWLLIQAPSSNASTVYIGGPNVTSSNGMQIVAGASINFPTQGNAGAYDLLQVGMVCANTTDSVRVLYGQ